MQLYWPWLLSQIFILCFNLCPTYAAITSPSDLRAQEPSLLSLPTSHFGLSSLLALQRFPTSTNFAKSAFRNNFGPIPFFGFSIYIHQNLYIWLDSERLWHYKRICELSISSFFLRFRFSEKCVINTTCDKRDYLLYIAYWLPYRLPIDCPWYTYVQP